MQPPSVKTRIRFLKVYSQRFLFIKTWIEPRSQRRPADILWVMSLYIDYNIIFLTSLRSYQNGPVFNAGRLVYKDFIHLRNVVFYLYFRVCLWITSHIYSLKDSRKYTFINSRGISIMNGLYKLIIKYWACVHLIFFLIYFIILVRN